MSIFFFLAYQPGDENINLDTTYYITGVNNPDLGNFIVTPQLYDIYPNPGQENIQIQFYMPDKREVSFQLLDINGKVIGVVKEKHIFQAGLNEFSYDISTLAKGNYLISFISEKYTKSKHFIKQ